MRLAALATLLVMAHAGCAYAPPRSTSERVMARDLARRFDDVYSPSHRVGLLRPRFGIPTILEGNQPLALTTLGRGEPPRRAALVKAGLDKERVAACLAGTFLDGKTCIHLLLTGESTRAITGEFSLFVQSAQPNEPPPVGTYDLVIEAGPNVVERAPRAVFYRAPLPPNTTARPLRLAQLSDVHLGHDRMVEPRLDAMIDAINQLGVDAVIVTGDLAEQGRNGALEERAMILLQRLDPPVLIAIGNHDYGHFPRVLPRDTPDHGFFHFARAFHAYRLFRTTLGGWDLLGFDSGPSLFSPLIMTRGIDEETLRSLGEATERAAAAGRNMLLFSHAPTRAAMADGDHHHGSNQVGSMFHGAAQLESLLLRTRDQQRQAIHLSGHTHWSDLFVGSSGNADAKTPWSRVPFAKLPCALRYEHTALMVNAPSATRISFQTIDHARAYGFVALTLFDDATVVQFHLYDSAGRPLTCRADGGE